MQFVPHRSERRVPLSWSGRPDVVRLARVATCDNCGATEPVGAVHVFRGAGTVLRCPHCDYALVKIVKTATEVWISFAGVRTLKTPG